MYQAVRAAAATNVDELQGLLLNLENVLIQENAEFFGSDLDHEPDHGHVSSRNGHDLVDLDEDPAPDRDSSKLQVPPGGNPKTSVRGKKKAIAFLIA